MSAAAAPSGIERRVDWWIALIVALNLTQALALARLYPEHRYDPDLLAYLTYFRNWLAGDRTLQHLPYFTAPKVLLVFGLGPLGDATLAFYCTAVASAALAGVLYLIGRDCFGRAPALLAAAVLLLEPSKAMLTLKSSADLYLAVFLFLAILLADRGRPLAAALCLLCSALIKPVTLPCAAYFLLGAPLTRRHWIAAALPFLAIPLIMLGNHALLGNALGGTQIFAEFASMGGSESIGPSEVVHFAIWTQLIKGRFLATASFGVVGVLLWVADDRTRLTRPLLLMPLLFLLGYVLLGAVTPFPPYFRYFWPLEIWFLLFLAFGAVEGARRLAAGNQPLRLAAAAVVVLLLADGLIGRSLSYRRDFALPLEQSMQFAESARALLRAQRQRGDVVLAPLGLLPFMAWEFPDATREQLVVTAERVARDGTALRPDWIIHIPGMYSSDRARERVPAIIQQGDYRVLIGDDRAVLLGPAGGGPPAAAAGGA